MLKINLDQPVLALFVRFVPKEWNSWPCMRVEVYGKPASKSMREWSDAKKSDITLPSQLKGCSANNFCPISFENTKLITLLLISGF